MTDTPTPPVSAPEAPGPAAADVPAGPVVTLDRVTVIYGKNAALKDVTAGFAPGAVGLLGPNGAGKSTMLKALLGFVVPDQGEMKVLGLDVRHSGHEIRGRIGYMPESDAHIPGMNAVSFVGYCGQLAGLPAVDAMQRAHEVLQYVGLGEARYRNVETYSTGMKQRIKLAQALVHDPDLLFLDEPTNGMDPKGRDEMLELIHDLGHNKRVNLILSSHLLPDVEHTCDHVVVMDKGSVAADGPIAALKGPAGRVFELRVKGELEAFLEVLRREGLQCHATDEDVMRVFVPDGRGARDVFALAAAHGTQVRHLRPSVPPLEDVFARALGEQWMPIHDQSYRRYGGQRGDLRRVWVVIAQAGIVQFVKKRAFLGLLLFAWMPFIVRAVQAYFSTTFAQVEALAINAETYRTFLDQQSAFVFFVTVFVGAGLIANDRRANALQIYLSKPLTRAEYILGKFAILFTFLVLVTWLPAILLLLLQGAFAGSFTFLRNNVHLVPAITLFSLVQVLVATLSMLALSSMSNSSRFVAVMYAGIVLFTDAMFAALRGILGSTGLSWISVPATLEQVGDAIFRTTLRYDTPVAVSAIVLLAVIVVSISVLERKVRGVEVVT